MKDRRILVVDDEVGIQQLFEDALCSQGYTLICSGSAEEALEILKERNMNVMFFDIKLPEMTGIELCREVRKDNPIALIFAMTGYGGLFELWDCREAGFDDYFAKPIRLEMILHVAHEAFDRLDRWKSNELTSPRFPFV